MAFTDYLAAKKSVDDASLNARVLAATAKLLGQKSLEGRPLKVVELGSGIGTMLTRLLEARLLPPAEYLLIDKDVDSVHRAKLVIREWLSNHDFQIQTETTDQLECASPESVELTVSFLTMDALEFAGAVDNSQDFDLLLAHALLDLLPLEHAIPSFLNLLRPSGVFYFTLNFDGLTAFEPEIDPQYDMQIMDLYHRSMDERKVDGMRSGDSRTGRHLFKHLTNTGAKLLEVGASDWVVFPREGEYLMDQGNFLTFILDMIFHELENHALLDKGQFSAWIAERKTQISRGELIFIAHQLDFLGKVP